jgi:hypothetical protein
MIRDIEGHVGDDVDAECAQSRGNSKAVDKASHQIAFCQIE